YSLDTYYRIIHLYKAEGNYPANSPAAFKRNVRRVAETFVYENGLLLYKGKQGGLSQRKTVMTTEERLAKMSEAHVKNGDHLSQFKVLDSLNSEKLYWKGMHTDVKAFVSACPGCRFGETKKKRKMQIKQLRWFKAAASDSEGDSDAETNIGNLSCNDLWMFIKRGVTPDTLSRSELLMFRKRAKSFKIEKGVLYYCPSNDGKKKARKVLRTEKEKQELIKKTHLGPGGDHLNPRAMKEILRTSVFWYGMSSDVENFVSQCCQCQLHEQSKPSEESDRQETALEEKVKLFQDYFAGKDIIPKQENLDLLFPKKENENDLVAEAMESAAVISPHLTNKSNKILQEEGDQIESNKGESQIPTTSFATGTESGKVFFKEVKESTIKLADEDLNGDDIEDVAEEGKKSKTFSINLKRMGSLSTQLRKSPLSVPKLPRTRKRCEICSEVILGENNFKAHMYKHTGVKPFQCNLCLKRFTNVKGLRLHSRKHTGHRPFLCSICGRGFPRSASLRYHIKTHERGNNSPITCDECQRTFTTMNRLIKHKGYKHPAKPPVYSCGQCGKCFTAKRSLKRHEDAHQGIRKYMCKYCKRRFFRKEYLNYHEVSHANEDPSILTNHKYRNKAKRPLPSSTKKKALPDGLLTFTLDSSSAAGLTQNQETYGQVVEVPDGWPQLQREQTFIYELGPDGNLVPTDPSQIGGATTTMVVMEAPSVGSATVSDTGMEFRHIFLPSQDVSHVQQQTHHAQAPHQQPYIHHHHQQQIEKVDQGQQQQHHENQSEEEIKLPPQTRDSLQQQHQYQQEQQQQQETHISPTLIKYTQEDIVSLQHHSNQEHYQQEHAPREISNAEQGISTDVSLQEPKSIEISLPSGTSHTFTLPAGVVDNSLVAAAGNPGEDTTTVQYQVECLSGETLTEADFNAIRKLAQASLAGGSHHLSQQ
ncbi:Zinc finger protein 878, partial [Plakobranchus ocellatus]